MKYYLIIPLLFLLLVGCSKKSSNPVDPNPATQGIKFIKTFGGSKSDGGRFAQQTTDGGYIITGYSDSFGDEQGTVYLIKTDSIGNKVWEKTFGGVGSDVGRKVQQTADGGFIIMGSTNSFGAV